MWNKPTHRPMAAAMAALVGSLFMMAGCGHESPQAKGTAPPARAVLFHYSSQTRHAVEAALEELKGETHALAECLTLWAQTEYSPRNILFVAKERTSVLPPELEQLRQRCASSLGR